MNGVNAELALTAARVRLFSERIPERHIPNVAKRWGELVEQVGECRSDDAAIHLIIEWRNAFEAELCTKLAHSPLEPRERGPLAVLSPRQGER